MSAINMTPLIDVMLVLLVIFMVATPLLVSSIKVELPQKSGAPMVQSGSHLQVMLDVDGRMWVGGKAIDALALERLLARAAASDQATELRLGADVQVPHGRVVEIMALAHRHGITRIGFVTRDTPLGRASAPAQPRP